MKPEADDFRYLVSKLKKQGLFLSGKTVEHFNKRGEGVLKYLEEHPEIEEFVILDDQEFDFREHPRLWERLLLTNGIERAVAASKTPAVETIIFLDYIKAFS